MDTLKEFLQFLNLSARLDLKAVSLSHILSLSGSSDGRNLLIKCPELLQSLVDLTCDATIAIAKDAVLSLVNISSDEEGSLALLDSIACNGNKNGLVHIALKSIFNEDSALADPWTMVLSNLTRPEKLVERVLDELLSNKDEQITEKLVSCFTRVGYNKKGASLDYIGPIFSNLSQCTKGRELFCNSSKRFLVRILPFIHHESSLIRRGGVIGLLKNICFDSTKHSWLLGEEIIVLPFILLPLAGPEEFDDDDNDKFPVELQYLGDDKKREEDPDLRKMLLESLAQLCATKKSRDYLRKKGTYEILREYHKWEASAGGDRRALLACENVVDILIRTEDEIGKEDLKTVEVPDDLIEHFEEMDKKYIEE